MSDGRPLRMGTRASLLARTQSGHVAAALTKATGRAVEEVLVRTEGDQLSTEGRIPSAGDSVGVFVRALDDALRRNEIDFAVHSLKDVPTEYAADLLLAAVPARADVRDALVVAIAARRAHACGSCRTGRGSPRRARGASRSSCASGPTSTTVTMAGNVDTRLRRLEEGRADALDPRLRRPRPALPRRADHAPDPARRAPLGPRAGSARHLLPEGRRRHGRRARHARRPARDAAAADAERSLLNALRAGCRAPVAALATRRRGRDARPARARPRPRRLRDARGRGDGARSPTPAELGRTLADRLLARGAERLVTEARAAAR